MLLTVKKRLKRTLWIVGPILFALFLYVYHKEFTRGLMIMNKSNYTIENARVVITHGANTPSERIEVLSVGHIRSGAAHKEVLSTGDALLKIHLMINGQEFWYSCGYTSQGLSHLLMISNDYDRSKCTYK